METKKLTPDALHPLHADGIAKEMKRRLLSSARVELQKFLSILSDIPYEEGAYAPSSDLFRLFEQSCSFDLPDHYHIEFGREINKACRDGRLPFRRKIVSRASIAVYTGLDYWTVKALLFEKR